MTIPSFSAQNGKANTVKKTFSRQTSIRIDINSDASVIWTLLTNASDYPRWNSTINSLEGEIKKGEQIRLKVHLDPKRTFKIKVREMEPEKRMVWGDGQGTRTFTLSKNKEGVWNFAMTEKIGGLLYPLYARMIPSFDEAFEAFASDLKKEAELIVNTKN